MKYPFIAITPRSTLTQVHKATSRLWFKYQVDCLADKIALPMLQIFGLRYYPSPWPSWGPVCPYYFLIAEERFRWIHTFSKTISVTWTANLSPIVDKYPSLSLFLSFFLSFFLSGKWLTRKKERKKERRKKGRIKKGYLYSVGPRFAVHIALMALEKVGNQ